MMFELRANPIVHDHDLKSEELMLALVRVKMIQVSDQNDYSWSDWLFSHPGQEVFESQ